MNPYGRTASSLTRARYRMLPLAAFCMACAALSVSAAAPERPARPRANLRGTAAERLEAAEQARRRVRGAVGAAELDAATGRETNPQVRYRLLQALAASDPAAAIPALTRVLRADPAPIVRVAAAQELGRLEELAATRALAAALAGDVDLDVRRAAAASLAVHRSSEAVVALAAAARHADAGLRAHAALSLSRQPAGRERDQALDRLERDPDAGVVAKTRAWRRGAAGRRGTR